MPTPPIGHDPEVTYTVDPSDPLYTEKIQHLTAHGLLENWYDAMPDIADLVVLSNVGTVVQAQNSDLQAIADSVTTTFGRSLLTLADAAAVRTAIGSVTTASELPVVDSGALYTATDVEAALAEVRVVANAGGTVLDEDDMVSDSAVFAPSQQSVVAYVDAQVVAASNESTSGSILIASNDAPARVKAGADYVCDGVDDDVQIQAALDANQWDAGTQFPSVELSAGQFYVTSPITLRRGQTVKGQSMYSTIIQVVSSFAGYVFESQSPDAYGVTIRDLFLNCDFQNAGGIHLENWGTTFSDPLNMSPDSINHIENVYINTPGTHAIHLDGSGGSQNSRGNRLINIPIDGALGSGLYLNNSSDVFAVAVRANTNRSGSGGYGFWVSGGSSQFVQCKSAYADDDGWFIDSSRAALTGCSAQDSGGYGFNIDSTEAKLEGCYADSNNRLGGGDAGFRIAASNVRVTGMSIDRNQTPGSRQAYGVRYASGDNIVVDITTDANTSAPEVGTWSSAANRDIRIMDSTLGRLTSQSSATTFS